ncbi:cell envelope integrity protein TolA [Salmonella enterica subsp. diarizonae]|uniref:Cell envelope integrity protein TolA n=1 Tax=Salmonella diarizonae TaxID=59204 RepID=A0A6C8Y5L3_SALDZ|nr:cell envelope integrity protein TolA [Salmonella enterica subsp. diarizonae]
MLKSLRFIPLCVLILSGHVFAADYGNHSSDSDAAKRVAAKAAVALGVDDLLSDLKSGVNVSNKPDASFISYVKLIRNEIKKQLGDSLEIYKGKQCVLRMHLARDGFVSGISIEGGSSDLCNASIDAVRRIKKFPAPPSDAIYQKIKDSLLDFNLTEL